MCFGCLPWGHLVLAVLCIQGIGHEVFVDQDLRVRDTIIFGVMDAGFFIGLKR